MIPLLYSVGLSEHVERAVRKDVLQFTLRSSEEGCGVARAGANKDRFERKRKEEDGKQAAAGAYQASRKFLHPSHLLPAFFAYRPHVSPAKLIRFLVKRFIADAIFFF